MTSYFEQIGRLSCQHTHRMIIEILSSVCESPLKHSTYFDLVWCVDSMIMQQTDDVARNDKNSISFFPL